MSEKSLLTDDSCLHTRSKVNDSCDKTLQDHVTFSASHYVKFVFTAICFQRSSCFIMVCTLFCIYWCSTCCPYHMMRVLFNSKTTGPTSKAGTSTTTRPHEFILGF